MRSCCPEMASLRLDPIEDQSQQKTWCKLVRCKMHALVATFRLLPLLCLSQFTTVGAQEFAPIATHIDAISDLNARLDRHTTAKRKLLRDHRATQQRLLKSRQDLKQVNLAALHQMFVQWEADLNRQILESNFRWDLENGNFTVIDPNSLAKDAMARVQSANAYSINVKQHTKQLSTAGQLTVERHQKIVRHLSELAQHAASLEKSAYKIQTEYLELADFSNVLSKYERKAAEHVLANTNPNFHAAQLALALTYIRLGNLPAAEERLNQLSKDKDPYRMALSLSLHAEIAAVRGDKHAAKMTLSKQKLLYGDSLYSAPVIRLLNARTYSLLNLFGDAKKQWNMLAESKRYPVAAQRGLANLQIQQFRENPNRPRYTEDALTHAKLASSLSAESEWSSQLVLALATAINGDFDAAATIAEQAADNAVLERKTQCLNLAEQLRDQEIPTITNVF